MAAFSLHPIRLELETFYPGKDLVVSSSPEETVQKVKYYLKHSQERLQIARQGRKAVEVHTYKSRAKRIITTLIEHKLLNTSLNQIKEIGEILYFKPKEDYETYQVEKGDTLYKISSKFGISIEELKTLNMLTSDAIIENQILKIRKRIN